jgi:hypothetical protein
MEVPFEKQFHFRDGTSVASLEQLRQKLESISYQEFYHHVNAQKNDFAAWVRYVLRDDHLADDLQRVTSIVETVEIINDYLHPRPITAQRSDAQSQIEQQVLAGPLPAADDEPTVVEQMPREKVPATIDFRKIEEKIGVEPKIEGKAKQELFDRVPDAKPLVNNDTDTTRMILKDFMYGLVFGLVIGVIIGRIISF